MIRNFTLTNALGQTYSLMNVEEGAMFQPGGLGYDDVTEYEQVGEFFAPLTERFGQQVITGQMVFSVQPYVKYLNFTKFCRHAPLSLVYETDAGTFQIPVRMTKIEKGDTDGWTYLQCPVEFTALARMYKTVVANNTGSAGGGKKYLEKSYPDVSGSIVTIMDNTSTQTTFNISADINAIQDLHGYNAPWVGGAGKNKFYNTWSVTSADVTYTVGDDASEVIVNGTSTGQTDCYLWVSNSIPARPFYLPNGEYTISVSGLQGDMRLIYSGSGNNGVPYYELKLADNNTKRTFTITDGTKPFNYFVLRASSGQTFDTTIKIQIESGSTATAWTPYENFCPISGHDEVTVTVADDVDNPTVSETYTIQFEDDQGNQITVYGGNDEIVGGELTVTHGIVDLGDLTWVYESANATRFYTTGVSSLIKKPSASADVANVISSAYLITSFTEFYTTNPQNGTMAVGTTGTISVRNTAYTDKDAFKTAMTGQKIVYELATPQTYQLTPQQVELLLGTNYVWANSGDVYLSNLKTYGYIYDYVYGDFVADTVAIDSDSVTASPCRISIFGPCTQPTWRHYVDGVQVATGYYNGTIPQNHKLVIDTTSSPYSIQEEDIAGNLIADRYELCDFSTERFFFLEYGQNTISVGHGDVDSIRLMVEGYIFYETV